MDIREIVPIDINVNIRELDIPPIDIWTAPAVGNTNVSVPPVTIQLGTPIVNIPGCVEAHESNNDSKTIGTDDENGLVTYCDAGVPSFSPIDYDKTQLKFTKGPTPTPQFKGEQPNNLEDTTPQPPISETSKNITSIQCPTQEQLDKEPVGFLFDSGRKEVLGYKLVGDQCIREVGDVPIITQVLNGLPPTGGLKKAAKAAAKAGKAAKAAKSATQEETKAAADGISMKSEDYGASKLFKNKTAGGKRRALKRAKKRKYGKGESGKAKEAAEIAIENTTANLDSMLGASMSASRYKSASMDDYSHEKKLKSDGRYEDAHGKMANARNDFNHAHALKKDAKHDARGRHSIMKHMKGFK